MFRGQQNLLQMLINSVSKDLNYNLPSYLQPSQHEYIPNKQGLAMHLHLSPPHFQGLVVMAARENLLCFEITKRHFQKIKPYNRSNVSSSGNSSFIFSRDHACTRDQACSCSPQDSEKACSSVSGFDDELLDRSPQQNQHTPQTITQPSVVSLPETQTEQRLSSYKYLLPRGRPHNHLLPVISLNLTSYHAKGIISSLGGNYKFSHPSRSTTGVMTAKTRA